MIPLSQPFRQRNSQVDSRRQYRLHTSLCAEGHDYRKFSTGSRETLWPAGGAEELRRALLDFHSRWYSANLMALCALGSESLDELESLVVRHFRGVRSIGAPVREWPEHPLRAEQLRVRLRLRRF